MTGPSADGGIDPSRMSAALAVRRSRLVETDALTGVVIEIDPTAEPAALAVLQARLHEPPAGRGLVFGYDIRASGLGAWVGDRGVRLTVWPALVDQYGAVTTGAADDAGADDGAADVLVIDFDPNQDRVALEDLVRVGRLIVAAPDAGPVPLVLDIDQDLLRAVLASLDG